MRAIVRVVSAAILSAGIALNSADAARVCKSGHFYYSGSEFHHDRIHAEASAVRAWRVVQARAHGARVAANMFPPSSQMRCSHAVSQEGWRCFVRGGPCHTS
jgi:hypothetical protein